MPSYHSTVGACAQCRACKGAAYQSPPLLGVGNPRAPIMVMNQNPGAIRDDDTFRLKWAENLFLSAVAVHDPHELGTIIDGFYKVDFTVSAQFRRLARAFGDGWLQTGHFYSTNAVRCRTEGNATPSAEMLEACSVWSHNLLMHDNFKAVIAMGAFAQNQLFHGTEARFRQFELMAVKIPTIPRDLIALNLPHPVVWKSDTIKQIQSLVKDLKKELDLP